MFTLKFCEENRVYRCLILRYGHFKIGNRNQRPCTSQWQKGQKVHILCQVCFEKKIDSITFSQFYICLNSSGDLHINIKNWGVTVLIFPEKRKIDPKIVIFVLLRTIVSPKRNNAIASVRSPLAIDAYLDEKCSPCARSVRSAYFDALYRLLRLETVMPKPP